MEDNKTPPMVTELLKKAVAEKGQSGVARDTGLTQPAIHRYLKGIGEPSTRTLKKLADYFGVSVAVLRGKVDALEIQLSSDDISLIKSVMAVSGYTDITDRSISEFASKLLDEALEEISLKEEKLREELAYNSKIIDHLHTAGGALADSWMAENQKELLDDLIMKQGRIVHELKEMGIDILAELKQIDG